LKIIQPKGGKMTNKPMLLAKMALNGYTAYKLAEDIKLSRQSMSYKINGKREFNVDEINAISGLLNLTLEERDAIFFDK